MPTSPNDPDAALSWPGEGPTPALLGESAGVRSRMESALAAGDVAAWYTDLATRERWWSAEMFALHGLPPTGAAPVDYLDLVAPEDRAIVQEAFAQSLRTGAHQAQYRVRRPDGALHWIEGIGRCTTNEDGGHRTLSGVCFSIDDRKREESDLRFLAQASFELARSTDYEETLRRVAALAVPHFADWCTVDVLDEAGELERLAVAHVDPAKVTLATELHRRYPPDRDGPRGTWHVARTGEAEWMASIPADLLAAGAHDEEHLAILTSLGLHSYMCVPIVGATGVLGVLTYVSSESARAYGPRDVALAADLASRAAVAIQNTLLVQRLRASERRQGFLLELTDALRRPDRIDGVLERVCGLLGRHFGVDRVGYGDVDEHLDRIDYGACWTDGTVGPLRGSFPASAFGQRVIDQLRAGHTVAIPNVREHPLTADAAAQQTSVEVETRAILVVPLVKAGRLRTIVYLNQRPARDWTAAEIGLMEEVAERTRELIERGRAERALRESEARWRGLFETMAEGFFVGEVVRDDAGAVVDFRFVEVNPAFETLTDVPAEAALGRTVTDVIPGIDPALIARYGRVVDSGRADEFELFVPELAQRWYEARAQSIGGDRFSVLFMDITARKHAQLDSARSAARYRTLFESIDEGFCLLEVLFDDDDRPFDYRFIEANPAFERQSGVVGAVGRTIRELIPTIESSYIETYGRVAATGESIRFESHAAALDRWFDAFAFRFGEARDRQVALLFTDITERRRTMEALRHREVELREAQALASIGSWSWDPAADRTDASPELLHILGRGEEPLPPFAEQRGTVYVAEDWDRLASAVQEALARGVPYALDLRALRHGQSIWVTARGMAVKSADGSVVGLRGTLQDITERKQIEQTLREADVRKDEFIATLAHELRNPLAPLRNGLAILRVSDAGSAAGVRARELMERQLAHLVRLVDDLLDASRVSQGKVEMKRGPTTLRSVVELALETSRPLVDAGEHALSVELPHEPVLLHADLTRLAQVLSNLLNNAAKYTPAGGHLRLVATLPAPDRVTVVVEDDGVGIPPDMLDRIFEMFTQVGGAQGRSQGGLGIGLSLARRLVELHGGTVRAESAGEGTGSRFIVDLPLSTAPGTPRDRRPELARPENDGARLDILVVDDNADAAETLGMLLALEGHDIRIAHSAHEALDVAGQRRPDVVFLDIGLPDQDGYQVALQLRARFGERTPRLVALTGWGAERDRERAKQAGFDLHLVKPVTPDDVAGALTRGRWRDGTVARSND